MLDVLLTRTNRKGQVLSSGIVAGPYETAEEAKAVAVQLEAADVDPRTGLQMNSTYTIVPHEECQGCVGEMDETGRAKSEHTC